MLALGVFPSRARMKFFVNLAQTVSRDVRVNLRRADVRVAEQFLDHAQIRAVLQKMRRKTVTHHVRRHVALDSGAADAIFYVQPKRDGRERRAALREKNICGRFWRDKFRTANLNVTIQRFDGCFSNRHDAFFVSFADDVDESCFEVQLFEPEIF